jgi:hypothetical protein
MIDQGRRRTRRPGALVIAVVLAASVLVMPPQAAAATTGDLEVWAQDRNYVTIHGWQAEVRLDDTAVAQGEPSLAGEWSWKVQDLAPGDYAVAGWYGDHFDVTWAQVRPGEEATAVLNFDFEATPPGPPIQVTGTPGDRRVNVAWQAPVDHGGLLVDGYAVTAKPGGKTCTTSGALTCAVTGLTNGTAYTFRVRADNDLGTGVSSIPSSAITPRTTPGAPQNPKGVPKDRAVKVSWQPPASNGGAIITAYRVTASPGGQTCSTTDAAACTVKGLSNGAGYVFTVKARNEAGWGAASVKTAVVTPRTVPGAPTKVKGTPSSRSVKVAWLAPASNGGSAITGYEVVARPGGRTCTTTGALTCTVTGLAAGKSHTFTVRAKNAAGWGVWSAKSPAVLPKR